MQTNIDEFSVGLDKQVDQHIIKYIDLAFHIPVKYIFHTKKRKRKLEHRSKLTKHVFWLVDKKYKMEGFIPVQVAKVANRTHHYEYFLKFRKIG